MVLRVRVVISAVSEERVLPVVNAKPLPTPVTMATATPKAIPIAKLPTRLAARLMTMPTATPITTPTTMLSIGKLRLERVRATAVATNKGQVK
jgi:hypothetical protein